MKKKISDFIRTYEMLQKGDRVLIALSGGADSVFLTLLLEDLRDLYELELFAIHVNHEIRETEADRDEIFVSAFCEAHGIPLRICHYPVPELARTWKKSQEETGREVRKEAFYQAAQELNCQKIALAHHAADLAETLLHHLARGTSLPGLGSMRPVRGREIRPLLCVSGEEIRQDLISRQIAWCEDSTNAQDTYTRNSIRHHVLPFLTDCINRESIQHIARTSLDLMETEEYLAGQTESLLSQYVTKQGDAYLLREEIRREPALLIRRVIRELMIRGAGQAKNLTRIHVDSVLGLLEGEVSRQICLPYQLIAERTYDGVILQKKESQITDGPVTRELSVSGEGIWNWDQNTVFQTRYVTGYPAKNVEKQYTKCIPYDKIKDGFTIRTRRSGDYLVVTQAGGTKKLKDILIDRKIPRARRDQLLLVCSGQEVLWVVGDRTGCWPAVEEGQKLLEITYQYLPDGDTK